MHGNGSKIVVDTSIWIDFFNERHTIRTKTLKELFGMDLLGTGDIILTEVLRGFKTDRGFRAAKQRLSSLFVFDMLGYENAIRSAENYRFLRKRGITVRATADVIIASFCIANGHSLLFSDADFEPFVEHLGLVAVR